MLGWHGASVNVTLCHSVQIKGRCSFLYCYTFWKGEEERKKRQKKAKEEKDKEEKEMWRGHSYMNVPLMLVSIKSTEK